MPQQGMPYQQPYQQAYQAQPGWGQPQPGQYPGMPMYAAPAPKQPSLFTDPKTLVSKLPLVALIILIGYTVYAVYSLISGIISATGEYGSVSYALMGIFGVILYLVEGLAWFAFLMAIKHLIDLKQADADAKADAKE